MSKPLILVTNDDGVTAPGIRALVEVAKKFGEVVVVAPDSPQSGQGHAITLDYPLRLEQLDLFENVEAYECSGTPVDCVKLAKHIVFKDRIPDLCLSGINHGSNASINIIYSGTMSAAMEASLEGIDSIGFSLLDFSINADFDGAKFYASKIIEYVLEHQLQNTKLLNVNIPKLPKEEIKGIKICRQCDGIWKEDFKEKVDPRGKKYYWMKGFYETFDKGEDTDIWALNNGFVSVVPSGHDLTMHEAISVNKAMETL